MLYTEYTNSVHNTIVRYAKEKIIEYSSYHEVDWLPNVVSIVGPSNYCGMMLSYGEIGEVVRATMVLCHDEIANLAEVDEIPISQAIDETIYHEWIHFVHAFCHPEDYNMLMTHEGELWDSMIEIGMDLNWIKRRAI